ncbi:MAG: phosphate acyltransferase PlsX [Phycisphaerales bacterium JB043]
MRLAVDVSGGDNAPDAIVLGAIEALQHLGEGDSLSLVGPEHDISEILREQSINDPRLVVEHAPDVIAMDESPVEAVRTKKDSSLVRMCTLASHKVETPVDAVISAGNTGACVSAATMLMRRLPGVHRPGIAVTLPTFHGPVVVCDAGANPEPRSSHLLQYAVMAETYAANALGIDKPRVAVLNIGSEEAKGTRTIKETRDLLKEAPGINYIGYIEARDLFDGATDVVVTDGFVGNTVLKLAEGLARSLISNVFHAIMENDPGMAAQLEPVARQLFSRNDYHEYGGAPLLGVNGVCMICHGSSESRTIANAIRTTSQYVREHVNDSIVRRLAEVTPVVEPHLKAFAASAAADPAA